MSKYDKLWKHVKNIGKEKRVADFFRYSRDKRSADGSFFFIIQVKKLACKGFFTPYFNERLLFAF